jgi:formamidopyrimidine-DNA glycosylase
LHQIEIDPRPRQLGVQGCQRGIHPARQADTLTPAELEKLYHAIRDVLNKGIVFKGASLDSIYRGGEFQNHFQAYGRTDEPCYRCGTAIHRIVLGGRSTHFCPNCQPLEPANGL